MNSTEKHELRERRRITAMLRRRMSQMDRSVNSQLRDILLSLTPTTDEIIQRLEEFADDVNKSS